MLWPQGDIGQDVFWFCFGRDEIDDRTVTSQP